MTDRKIANQPSGFLIAKMSRRASLSSLEINEHSSFILTLYSNCAKTTPKRFLMILRSVRLFDLCSHPDDYAAGCCSAFFKNRLRAAI
jgi:hypothetical protein